MALIINGTDGVQFNDSSLQGAAASPFGLKNKIINGDMVIDQRNAGASVTVSSAVITYPVDRFFVFQNTGSSSFTTQRSTVTPSNFNNSLLWTTTTGVSSSAAQQARITQRVEGFNVADLAWGTASAQTVTISFWVRSSITGTFAAALLNSAGNRAYVATFTVSAANTWEKETITIPGDTSGTWLTDNSTGIQVVFDLGSGSNFSTTAGSWAAGEFFRASGTANVIGTTGATFYITGVQLERNTTATPFEWIPYSMELALCQRYYQRTPGFFGITAPATQTDVTGAYSMFTPMRANPTGSRPSTSRFHRPGVAFYNLTGLVQVQDLNGNGYTIATIDSGAGLLTSGQIVDGLNLSAEL
jgi:hypothetical protein